MEEGRRDVQVGMKVLWPIAFSREAPVNASHPCALLLCGLANPPCRDEVLFPSGLMTHLLPSRCSGSDAEWLPKPGQKRSWLWSCSLGIPAFRTFICHLRSLLTLRPQCWRDHAEAHKPQLEQSSAMLAAAATIRCVSAEDDSLKMHPASAAIWPQPREGPWDT